jgi:hypothetical protein
MTGDERDTPFLLPQRRVWQTAVALTQAEFEQQKTRILNG